MNTDEILALLRRMDSGELDFWCAHRGWKEIYAGDVLFVAADGHRVVVFNDCNEWDYVDSVYAPGGTLVWSFPAGPSLEHSDADSSVINWQPEHPSRWEEARVVKREAP